MSKYDGAYKVVNRDWNQSLPDFFNTFEEALQARDAWDTTASIEQIDGATVNVVWTPDYENFVSNVHF